MMIDAAGREARHMHYTVGHSEAQPDISDLVFYYQPIFGVTRRPQIYEALVRWLAPDGSVRGPDSFLHTLLSKDRADAFTEHTIECTAKALTQHPDLPCISVNLSPAQLCRLSTLDHIATLDPEVRRRLMIEVTEDPITNREAYCLCIGEAARLGVNLVLDDIVPEDVESRLFPKLPVSGIKLDRSVLPGLICDEPDPRLLALIRHFRRQKLTITVEGVDTPARLPRLIWLGADRFQGFGLGMPAPTLKPMSSD
jgi:Amt family ammonium transporter